MYFDVNGRRVFATTGGKPFDPSNPVIVFLHGSGSDHTVWNLQSRFFAFRGYAVLVPDLPGHTNSAGPPLRSIAAMADWLENVAVTLEIERLSIVAHSQGCLVALEYAARFPDRLMTVTLITGGLALPVNDALLDAAANDADTAIAMMTGWGFGHAGHFHQGPIPGGSMVENARKILRGNTPDALAADLNACNDYANGKVAAAKVRCPAQVIVAGKDRMVPRAATDELIAHLDDPEVAIVPHCGHTLPQEAPNECRQLLRDFIFRHSPAV